MNLPEPADLLRTVREHAPETEGYLLASAQPCLAVDEAALRASRRVVRIHPGELAGLRPGRSWAMAVLVCPGEDTSAVAEWARARRAEAHRVWFYLHPDASREALRPWREAGYRTERVETVRTWRELSTLLGLAVNDVVYRDFADAPTR
jgi:hypothetical protein